MKIQTQETMIYPAMMLDQSMIDSLENTRIKIRLLLGAMRYNVPGEHLNNVIIDELASIRKTVINDTINICGTDIIPEPDDLPTIQRVTYSSILLSFVIQDRYYCKDLNQVLDMIPKMRELTEGFLFYDLFFLLIAELHEIIKSDIEDADEIQKITAKYDQEISEYLTNRNGKIDDFSEINPQISQEVQEKLNKSK